MHVEDGAGGSHTEELTPSRTSCIEKLGLLDGYSSSSVSMWPIHDAPSMRAWCTATACHSLVKGIDVVSRLEVIPDGASDGNEQRSSKEPQAAAGT